MSAEPKRCQFCGEPISMNYEYHVVREATKPPRTPHRWQHIGYACDACGDSNSTSIDPWKEEKQ